MRVLIVPSWYFPIHSNEIGGRMFHQMAKGLREKEIEASIFFGDFSTSSPIFKKTENTIEEGVPTYRVSNWFPPKMNAFLMQLWINKYAGHMIRYIKVHEKPDILHAQSYMAGLVCAAVSKKTNIPFVYTERVSTFITGKVPERHKSFIRSMMNVASAITCVSPGLQSHMKSYTEKNIEIIPNFFDPLVFHFNTEKEKFKKFTWISVGEPAHTKGLDVLLKAYTLFRKNNNDEETQLLLIDKIRGKDELIRLSRELNIEDHILWEGLIPQPEVADLLQKSHVFISASRVETFGKSIMEALACGLPVIATKTDGAQFIIDIPLQGKLVEPNNVEDLAQAMEDMFINYSTFKPGNIVMSTAVRFQKEVVMDQWKNFYLNLRS